MKPYIYLRGLRAVEHTVFVVQDGQKNYYDPTFNKRVAYSSGQQVKRSILDKLAEDTGEGRAPITFNYEINAKDELSNKEPWSPCDPAYADQLIGGWMRARPGVVTLKRRSPLSISAMRPLHPYLVSLNDENLTFDRSEQTAKRAPVRVLNAAGQEMTDDDIATYLKDNKRTLPRRHWIPDNTRTTGLFVFDIAIDLKRLFSVSINQHEPELDAAKIESLQSAGWVRSADGERLIAPASRREQLIPALATALVNWQITSNQARTYSPQPTLALAISDNASRITGAIRADLSEDDLKRAEPVAEAIDGVSLFTSLTAKGYLRGTNGMVDAMERAEQQLINMLSAYSYEN
ncbi:CRISPR-associated protein Cas7 [Fibrella sp. WM1]|uniref:CRISPR-associated protein Cas7 n=1 Tax=Fibrella musci TaxID=3242485 RepID=UPI003522D6BA